MSAFSVYAEEIEVKEFKIGINEPWKVLSEEAKERSGFAAVWINPKSKQPNAALLAKKLPKTVSKEADQMVASAKRQSEYITLIEDRKVELKDGGEARVVSLEIRAGNQQLRIAAPMVFHSVYLPTKDGISVTFKLQCGKTDLAVLKPDFEASVFKGLIQEGE